MTRRLLPWCGLLGVVFAALSTLQAEVRLPSLISDHMVVQQEAPVRIWGEASAGERVEVSFRGQRVSTTAGPRGNWAVYLKPMTAGGPFEMTVRGNNAIAIRDVLVGEVWVGSGQSNMVWPVERSNNADTEIASADFPQMRLFKVELKVADEPLEDVEGSWQVCSPETVADFSAVAYFFGRSLHKDMGVPFGLIQSAWGGTPAESWTSLPALNAEPLLQPLFDEWDQVLEAYPAAKKNYEEELAQWERAAAKAKREGREAPRRPRPPRGPGHQHTPAGLYNAMIAPLTPFAIRGAIWYQGENNGHRGQGYLYRRLFKTMILDWRRAWAQGDFPFLFVQLANYDGVREGGNWPELREAQAMALDLRGTGMAVTIDIGESDDIHPRNKQDVGERLALAARAVAYGQQVVHSGPRYRQTTTEGNRIRLWFDDVAGGLVAKGGELKGFTIAGADRRFVPASAEIDGKTIVVWNEKVKKPVAARYGWADDPPCNLYNRSGLPASPFRTDQWRDAKMPEVDFHGN